MTNRRSVDGENPRHVHPVPNASRIGPLIMSSIISGVDATTKKLPETMEEQVANIFSHIRHDVEAAGASVDDIIKISFWIKDPVKHRALLNPHWLAMFPNAESRPAREALPLPPESESRLHANFVAYVV